MGTMTDQAQIIREKVFETKISYRHNPCVHDFFIKRWIKKIVARILGPITSLLYDLSKEFHSAVKKLETHDEKLERYQKTSVDTLTQISRSVAFIQTHLQTFAQDEKWDQFYSRFENRFRGSREVIYHRLRSRYEKRFASLKRESQENIFLDLGCGKGELLEIGRGVGFQSIGIDLSTDVVGYLKEKGYEAHAFDILAYLKSQPDHKFSLISMMHVIEHCPMNYMYAVFEEACRVLNKGGAFLVETPSLLSLWSGARQFFLDPTHLRPIHPDFIRYMAEDVGFSKVEGLEFDEVIHPDRAKISDTLPPGSYHQEFQKLEKWLYGPMDFSIWAVK